MKKNSVLIIGKIPLPIGGVTIHVKRLMDYCSSHNIPFEFYDLKNFSLISLYSSIRRHTYAHLHTSSPYLRLFFAILSNLCRTKSILTIHGNLLRFGVIKNISDKFSIKLCSYPIVINKNSYNIAIKLNKNTKLYSAYIPSIIEEPLPSDLVDSISELKKKYSRIIVTNAYNRSFDKDGAEIYGIDFLINLFKTETEYAFIISDPSGSYYSHYYDMCKKADNILIINYPHSFIKILEHSNYYIRNTSTDGDSLSIHEAIDMGVRVFATDVVDRPDDVIIFKRDDKYDLLSQLKKTDYHVNIENKSSDPDIIKFYKTIL